MTALTAAESVDAVNARRPGHYRPGADTNHFPGRCTECDVHYLAGMNLGEVEYRYQVGRNGQDLYEAYRHVWATSAHRHSGHPAWRDPPASPVVAALAADLRRMTADTAQTGTNPTTRQKATP